MKMCLKCYEDALKCKCNVITAEIDDMMFDAISLLNKKGYITLYCCSGHLNRKSIQIYVYIDNVNVNDFKTIPKNWKTYNNHCIEILYLSNDKRFKVKAEFLVKENIKFYKWVCTLPSLYDN